MSYIILTGNVRPRPIPCWNWTELEEHPTEKEAEIVFATVPDTQEVPLANQILHCLSWDLVGYDCFYSEVL